MDRLWEAYASSHLDVRLPDGGWVTFEPVPGGGVSDRWPVPDVTSLHVITAWNPGSAPQDREENEAAQRRLVGRLDRAGWRWLEAVGRAPDGSWSEPSLAVADVDHDLAVAVCRDFGQRALYLLDAEGLDVVGCTDGRRVEMGWRLAGTGARRLAT